MAKTKEVFDDQGRRICGAKTKTRVRRNGEARKNTICHRWAMSNGRCLVHGGKSTGPKNSLGYYKKTVLAGKDDIADLDPFDLHGEIALAREALEKFHDDPLQAFCLVCRKWVTVEAKCPSEEYDEKNRKHPVHPKNNDYSEYIKGLKVLSDISKNFKEIQRGKEVVIKVEILNFIVARVVQAYEEVNLIGDPDVRRRKFVEAIDALSFDSAESPVAEPEQKTRNR